ncbi:gp58-like family protein [Streptococcus suis]|uniref:gp58-like family protein n=1 Tax=Streptococcus suis TaxID=1307 RepID=UPI0003F8BA0A|nr:gp58-like family protein [Streptococcus suis]HEM3179526.1 hypothetical protein [Streptococcus suis 92-4172]
MVHTVTFNQAMLAKDRVFAIRAGAYTSSDIKEASFNYGYISGDTFKPGGTVAGSAKLTFTSIITSFNKLDKVYPEIGLKVGDSFEWVAMGEYFVNDINIDRNRNTTELDLIDGMFKLNQPYISDLTYPAQIRDVIREICVKTGVELETDDLGFRAIQHHIQSKADKKDITFREVLSQAIQLLGFSAFFNRKGKLEIRGLIESNITITADNYFLHGLTKSEFMYQIAGITCKKDKETLTVGLRTGRSLELENNFMIQNILDDLYYDLKNIRYYPYSLEWQGHLKLDVGQWVTLKTNKNETFKVPVLSQSFNFKGGLKSKISADSKAGNDTQYAYKGFLGKRIEQMSTEIEAEVQQQLEYKDKEFDEKINKAKSEINDGIEQSTAEAAVYADNIKRRIDKQLAESNRQYQLAQQNQDRQIADVLANTNLAKQLAEQAKADLAQTRTNLTQLIDQANTKTNQLEQSLGSVRTDVMSQAQSLLAQARAQADLTSRVATVETTANGTKATLTELSKTVNKATGDIASVTSRTKTVEDNLSQTRTQYEALTQTVNAQTGQIDSINRKTADLQSGIDGVTERFENLRIEENLLLNSSFNQNLNQWQGTGVTIVGGKARITGEFNKTKGIYQSIKSQTANDDVSQVYIASISVKVSNYAAGSINPYLALYINGIKNDSAKTWFGATYLTPSRLEAVNNKGIVQFTTTFKVNVPRSQIDRIEFHIYARDFTGEVEFEKVSLRRGNIDLGWQASPEDLRFEIATYKRTAEESSAELSRQIQTVDGKAVDAKTYAQQTATAINTRLESLETYKNAEGTRASQYFTASRDETARQVSALRTAVTDGYVAKAKYKEDARGITQRFESLQVGGRNLLASKYLTNITTSERFTLKGWASTFINSANLRNVFKAGETYTLSFDAKILAKSSISKVYAQQVGFLLYSRSTNRNIGFYVHNLRNANDSARFELTFVCPEIADDHYVRFYTNRYADGTSVDYDTVEFSNVNLMTGNIVSKSWIAPQEDQQSYADTKIAEYKNTVDGRFATMQSQVSGKANQVDLQTVRETVNLYERIIGSTETGIKDKVARMVMADSLFLTEVKNKISGTATQVSQLSNSYAIKNLTSAGTVLNQINLLANGTNRIDGRLTHITGQTLIDNGVINNAMIGNLDAGKISTGTLNAARIATNSIDGSKLVFDQAFVNKMTANEALFKQLFAKNAFITSVQAVTMSASKIVGGLLRATNGAVSIDLNRAKMTFNSSATIEFNSSGNALIRKVGDVTGFLHFNNATAGGTYVGLGVTSHNEGVKSQDTSRFAGVRIFRSNDTTDQTEIYGDKIYLGHAFGGHAVTLTPTNLTATYELSDLIKAIKALWRCWLHWNNTNWNPDNMDMRRSIINEYNAHNIG